MRLEDARDIIHEVSGKPYSWLRAWGMGTIKEAIRTIDERKSATDDDRQEAEYIKWKIARRY